jgi:hypothetical protein
MGRPSMDSAGSFSDLCLSVCSVASVVVSNSSMTLGQSVWNPGAAGGAIYATVAAGSNITLTGTSFTGNVGGAVGATDQPHGSPSAASFQGIKVGMVCSFVRG